MAKTSRQTNLMCILLAGITLALYWPATSYPFGLCDDPEYVIHNEAIHEGVTSSSVAWAFGNFYSGNWHPLTWLSHALDCQMFGLNPGWHHLTSILLHAANVALLFLLLKELLEYRGNGAQAERNAPVTSPGIQRIQHSALLAFILAALFAWHPLRVESVAWISERKDVLSGFFFLLTLLAYLRYVQVLESKIQGRSAITWYGFALGLFALGLLSKQMVVTVPCVLLLLDFWPFKRVRSSNLSLLWEKIPFFILSTLACVATIGAQAEGMQALERVPFRDRVANALGSYALYLWKTIWPRDLVFVAYWRETTAGQAIGAAALLGVITALALWQWKRRPYLLVGWFWFLGMLVPVIGIIQVGLQSMADRYTYLPSIGLLIMLGGAVMEMFKLRTSNARDTRRENSLVLFPSCMVLVALLAATWIQIGYWRDTKTLLAHCIDVTGGTATMENDLGIALDEEGRSQEAGQHFRRATELSEDRLETVRHPRARAHANLGGILAAAGKWTEAEEEFRAALRGNPTFWKARSNLGDCLAAEGRLDEAVKEYRGALKVGGDSSIMWHSLGVALNRMGNSGEALKAYRAAARLDSTNAVYLNELAWFLATDPHAELRNGQEAAQLAQQACEATGNQEPRCLGTLDAAYAEAGRFDDAINTARQARELALAKGQTDIGSAADERLKLYLVKKPYHQGN